MHAANPPAPAAACGRRALLQAAALACAPDPARVGQRMVVPGADLA